MVEILAIDHRASLPHLSEGLARFGRVTSLRLAEYRPELLERFATEVKSKGAIGWVHPGSSPLAESVAFSQLCVDLGLIPIMPPPRSLTWATHSLQVLQDTAKRLGPQSTLLIHEEPLAQVREVEHVIESRGLGFPFVLRSAQGCGGQRGIWVVRSGEELREKGLAWFEQIRSRFEIPLVFMERVLTESRHWVLPFVRFSSGETRWLGISEASLQWRCRKVIEWFAPFSQMEFGQGEFGFTPELSSRMREMGQKVLESAQFVGVGAMEFLAQDETPYLVGVLPRLPRHWFAWSSAFGVDALDLQLRVALQIPETPEIPIAPAAAPAHAWAVVARVIAEDPLLEIPKPGTISEWERPPQWVGAQDTAPVDLSFEQDATLGWILATGESRRAAAVALHAALGELWIAGTCATNERHLRELLEHPWVREGMFHAGFVDEEFLPRLTPDPSWGEFLARVPSQPGAQEVPATLLSLQRRRASAYPLPAAEGDLVRWRLRIGDWFLDQRIARGARSTTKITEFPVRALCSGRLRQCSVRSEAWVPAHTAVCMIESVGTWVPHPLPRAVVFDRWVVGVGDEVKEGQVLGWVRRAPKD